MDKRVRIKKCLKSCLCKSDAYRAFLNAISFLCCLYHSWLTRELIDIIVSRINEKCLCCNVYLFSTRIFYLPVLLWTAFDSLAICYKINIMYCLEVSLPVENIPSFWESSSPWMFLMFIKDVLFQLLARIERTYIHIYVVSAQFI